VVARGRVSRYKSGVRGFFRWVGRLIGVAVVLALVGLAYMHVAGVPPRLIRLLEQQITRTGVVLRFAAIRLDLFRGIVATRMELADARAPAETLVEVDEVVIVPNWRGLAQQRQPLRAVRITNATIAVPTPADEEGSALFTAQDAYATVLFGEDGTVVLDRLTGLYCGIQLYVTGQLKPAGPEARLQPQGPSPFRFVTKVVRELNRIKVSEPPQLDLNFELDLARPLEARARVRLRGQGMELRGAKVDEARVIVTMQDGAVEFPQFELELYRGAVRFRGRYDVARGAFDLEVTSSTDPTAFAGFAPPAWGEFLARDVKVQDNPRVALRYRLSPETGPLPELQGSVLAGAFAVRGVEFLRVDFEFANHGPRVTVTNALVVMAEGQLTGAGEINIESTDFHYQVVSTLDPPKLLPVMSPVMRRIVEPSWFASSPRIVAQIRGDFVDPDAFAYDATVEAGACRYRGVDLERASARLKLRESLLDVRELLLVRPEGEVSGTVRADFNEHVVEFDIASTANPNAVAPLLGPVAAATLRPYRFGPRTDGNARGRVDFVNPTNTAWTAHVVGEGFSYWKLTADRAEANLTFANNTFQIEKFTADFYGGKLTGAARFDFAGTNVTYRFQLAVERGDVTRLLADIGGAAKATGNLAGELELRGAGDDARQLVGRGSLSVADGVLWEAPLFGPLSHVLGKTKATSARADFTISQYAWRSENLTVEAGAFTARAPGRVDFDGKLDFRVQAQFLRQIPGLNILTKLIGVLLEYDVGGTINNPSYRAANLPKELLPHSGRRRED